MNYTESKQIAPTFQSNYRAEDGPVPRSRWNSFCEGVLLPIGSLFAIFLFMLGAMLILS